MKRLLGLAMAGCASLLALIPDAQAAVVSNTFSVNVTLSSICTATTTNNINFGTYTAFGSAWISMPWTMFLVISDPFPEVGSRI